jgi:hypothetical protein
MTIKIDELNARYLIPGVDFGTTAVADPDGTEEDYSDAPYSQVPAVTDIPSPTGWQDLLGLNQVSPSPSQIDPPPLPVSLGRGPNGNIPDSSLRSPGGASDDGMGAASTSAKVERMLGMLASYDQVARKIRARASESGGQ